MQTLVVPTKITVPPVQRELAGRPRLMARLERGLASRLTLVSAPAGYGKTMLLAAWARQSSVPVAWISIDERDNDPARFLRSLAAALEQVHPGLGRSLQGPLEAPQTPLQEDPLSQLLLEITAAARPFALVLDDYHLIHERAVHVMVDHLIQHLPPAIHPVIATRADPPLQIARLRARNELAELRLVDLCFTPEEAAVFFNQVMKLGLTGEQVAALNSRTEGWVAGLQLAALSMETVPDRPDFIRSFSGSNRFILDYLVDEVLKSQPEEIHEFLVQTSVIERLSGALCDAVTGRNDSQRLLEQLEQANLFLIPLDTDRTWYRYHQLFRDLLLKQASRRPPDELAEWRRRAAGWFDAAGMTAEAIEYSLAAGDVAQSVALVRRVAPTVLMHGEMYTFAGWLRRLPEEVLLSDPDLGLYRAWALALSDTGAHRAEAWLERLDLSAPEIAARAQIIRGFLAYVQANPVDAVRLLNQGLAGLPASDTLFRYVADYTLSAIYIMLGDLNTGARALEQTVQVGLRSGQIIWAAGAMCELGEIHIRHGDLHAARADFERALAVAVDDSGRPLPAAGRARMRLGELWREWNDLPRAAQEVREGMELARRLREGATMVGYVTLSEILQAAGDAQGAWEAVDRAEELARRTTITDADDLIVACFRAALAIHQGRLAEAQAWAQARGLTGRLDPRDLDDAEDYYKYHVLKYELLALARLWIASGRAGDALPMLDTLRVKMEEQGRVHQVIRILLLIALAHTRLGDLLQAQPSFERSLALAEPGGYVRMFLDEGEAVRPLLERAAQQKHLAAYASRLLAALDSERRGERTAGLLVSAPSAAQDLRRAPEDAPIEALTEREVELLRLIAEGLTNQQIAGRLVISLPTVKWHTSKIYARLGVSSRTQAVARGRALGLLEPVIAPPEK